MAVGRHLALATWNVNERVRRRGTHDHVRLLAADRLQAGTVVRRKAASAYVLVAIRVPTDRRREPAVEVPRLGIRVALAGKESRADEQE